MTDDKPTPELVVPHPLGVTIGASILTLFLLATVSLAVSNLLHWTAPIPSTIWLLLVGGMIFGFCRDRGMSKFITDTLGPFARDHFVRATPGNLIQFGYRILGHQRFYLIVPADRIDSVNWSTGQATHMAGRDMNDWSVAVWYDHGDPALSQRQKNFRKPDQELIIVGPTGKRSTIAAFGLTLVDYLRKAGVSLLGGANDCTFLRAPNVTPPTP